MIKKAIFVVVFAAVHSQLTVLCVARWLNFNAAVDVGLWPRFVNLCARALSLPLLLPLMAANPDGERFPAWFRQGSVLMNSLIWAVLLLALCAVANRLRNTKEGIATPNKAIEPTGETPAAHG